VRTTLIVRDADGVSPRWPEPGRTVEIGVLPNQTDGAEPPPPEAPTTLIGGCSATGSPGGAAWMTLALLALLAWRTRSRVSPPPAKREGPGEGRLRSTSVIALLALSGCAGALCDSEAACASELAAVAPNEGSARGGEIARLDGIGLARLVGVRFGDRPTAIVGVHVRGAQPDLRGSA
jgi:uncharacterized protein (TIGR03382 family)